MDKLSYPKKMVKYEISHKWQISVITQFNVVFWLTCTSRYHNIEQQQHITSVRSMLPTHSTTSNTNRNTVKCVRWHTTQTWNKISLRLYDIAQNERKRQLVFGMTRYYAAEEFDGCRLNLQLLFTAHQLHHTNTQTSETHHQCDWFMLNKAVFCAHHITSSAPPCSWSLKRLQHFAHYFASAMHVHLYQWTKYRQLL